MNSKLIIYEYKEAGDKLLSENFHRQAIIMYWIACRFLIFHILSINEIHYVSTRNALLEFMKSNKNNKISSQVWVLDSIATLCEWNPEYKVNKMLAIKVKKIFNNIITHYE